MQVDRQDTTLRTPTSKLECRTLSLMCMFFLWGGQWWVQAPPGTKVGTHPPSPFSSEWRAPELACPNHSLGQMEPLSAPPGLLHP